MSVQVSHLKQNHASVERDRPFAGFALASVMTGLLLTLLLESLDQTIVSTAAPRIISQLRGFDLYTWVVTAYLLASTTIIPIVSKLSDQFGRKWFLIAGVVIFLLGSALSGTSQTMNQLIIFRTIQGVGAGVCLGLVFVVVGDIFPPAKRAKWQGVFSAVYGLSSVAGPMIGGWLTDNGPLLGNLVTSETRWRWVFYINLPLGAVALLALLVYLPANLSLHEKSRVGKATLRNIDVLGALLAAAATICLLLGLTWGGVPAYGWGSSLVISLLVAAGLLFIAFGFAERFAAEPILPLHLLRNQIFAADAALSLLIGMVLLGSIVYLPLFLQGGLGESASNSGALLTPITFSVVIGATISGMAISVLKRYQVVTIVGSVVMSLGVLLLSRMSLSTSLLLTTVSMVVAGIGIGMVFSVLTLIIQNALPRSLMGVGTGAVNYLRQLGGALGVAIVGTVFNHTFSNSIVQQLPGDIVRRLPSQGLALVTDPQVLINDSQQRLIVQMVGRDAAQRIFDGLRLSLTTATQLGLTTVLLLCIAAILAACFLKDIPLATRFSDEATGSGNISVSNEPIRSVPASALNVRNNGRSYRIDDFTPKIATEHAVDTHLYAEGQFSRVGKRSRGKIPARVRLVPL